MGKRNRKINKTWIISILIVATLFTTPYWFRPLFKWFAMPEVGRNVSLNNCPVKGLPQSATSISYTIGGLAPSSAYEFTTSELDFLNWAKSNGWPMQPITQNDAEHAYRIQRFGDSSLNENDARTAEIMHGFSYEWVDPQSSDVRLNVAYDSDLHRAYYYRSSR